MIRHDTPEPVLILSDAEYRRAFSPPERRVGRGAAWGLGLLLTAASAAAAVWWARETPRPPAPPVAVSRPRVVPAQPSPEPVPEPPVRAVAVVSAPPEEEEPPVAAEPPPPAPKAPWCGGRAWVTLRLRMDRGSQIQECERRVTIVEEGSRYIVERPAAQSGDVWLDRLELLLQLPDEDESWRRRITLTRAEAVHLQKGDVACRVVEGEDQFPQGVRRFRYWYSDEFRAGALQAEQTLGDLVFACRVLDFGPAPSRKP